MVSEMFISFFLSLCTQVLLAFKGANPVSALLVNSPVSPSLNSSTRNYLYYSKVGTCLSSAARLNLSEGKIGVLFICSFFPHTVHCSQIFVT